MSNSRTATASRLPDRRPYPTQIIIDVHSYCNARCVICPYDRLKDKLPMGVMEEDLFRKIVDDYAGLCERKGFRGNVIFCSMGEFFLYPEVSIERMGYVIEKGLDFGIQTNASAMLPKWVDLVIERGFTGSFTISCHGVSPEAYEPIMGLDLERTLANIDYLIGRYPREKVCIQAIPHGWPFGETRKVRRYWRQRGVHVRMPLPNDRAGLVPGIKGGRRPRLLGCNAERPLYEMICNIKGEVQLCCNDMAQKEIVGSLAENTIEAVWNGAVMQEKLAQIYEGAPAPDDFICYACESAITSTSPLYRLNRNLRYEMKKIWYTRIR